MSKCRLLLRLPAAAAALLVAALLGSCDGAGGGEPAAVDRVADDPSAPVAWFTDITAECGLGFRHESGGDGGFLLPEIMGSGAAMFDADGDGDLDLYLTSGNRSLPGDEPAAGPLNRFLRQEAGGRFVDDTDASGLGDGGYANGVAVGDLDNDGDLDVYVANYGRDQLFLNDGRGRFANVTVAAGVDVGGWSSSAAFLDFDRDGWLDLYVSRYVHFDPPNACREHAGRPDYCGPTSFPAVHDVLLRNLARPGSPAYEDVSERSGLTTVPAAAGLGVVCEDLDGDGWIDVYVANDGYPNHFWRNSGDGRFVEAALPLGAAFNAHGQPEAGMGIVAADLDGDQDLDLFLTHQARETNTLYLCMDDMRGYRDATGERGLAMPSVTSTGFGAAAFDCELDGDLDLLVVGGRVIRSEPRPDAQMPSPWDRYAEPNQLYLNDGDGRFTLAPGLAGTFASDVEISRGLAVGDIDGDGDLDVLVTNIQGPARLFRNDAPRRGHWLLVRALDASGRDALGAQLTVVAGGRRFLRTISAAFSYQSSSDPRAHLGLGDAAAVDSIDVRWPDGSAERFPGITTDRAIELRQGAGEPLP